MNYFKKLEKSFNLTYNGIEPKMGFLEFFLTIIGLCSLIFSVSIVLLSFIHWELTLLEIRMFVVCLFIGHIPMILKILKD